MEYCHGRFCLQQFNGFLEGGGSESELYVFFSVTMSDYLAKMPHEFTENWSQDVFLRKKEKLYNHVQSVGQNHTSTTGHKSAHGLCELLE